ncbi:MAG TPA: nucleoside deaminase [Bacteroidales bacterium]|nr:nucleoside deaminase [Bacteroidales bacterium]
MGDKINITDEQYMRIALKEANLAFSKGEVPIGAIIVCHNKIISKAHNQTEILNDATAHAEMLAITGAMATTGSKYLNDCTLYVTVEPCLMCAGAIHWSKIRRIVFGTKDPKKGFSIYTNNLFPKKIEITTGILAKECMQLLLSFFKTLR